MIRKLHIPKLPQNERNRVSQISVDLTKRKAYRSCLAVGQCKGDVVGGHVIPRSWLRKICDKDGRVRVFSQLPLNIFKEDFDEAPHFPGMEHFNNAFVGSFTCQGHEELFFPIDSPDPDWNDSRILNLMVYKPIIAGLWREKLLLQSTEAELAEVPESELFQSMVELQRQRVIGLEHYKKQTEECLNPWSCKKCNGGTCQVIAHKIFEIPGEPALAVSDFSDGIRTRINPRFGLVEYIVNWGITVLPVDWGHKVVFHHFVEEESTLEPMSRRLAALQGRKLQGEICYRILKSFENIAISPERWKQIGEARRQAIFDVFNNEMPEVGFGSWDTVMKWERERFRPDMPAPNPNQLNLFNANKR